MILKILLELISNAVYVPVLVSAYLLYNYWRNYTFWSKSGLPYIPFPRDSVIYPVHKAVTFKRFYDELAPHPAGGFYKMSTPYLMIRDPEIIRRILVKDFVHFVDRGIRIHEDLDPLNRNIFNLEGERWKVIRHKLSPLFAPGKIKSLWPRMKQCAGALEKYLDHTLETRNECDLKEVMSRFTLDVIATCSFGFKKCEALENDKNELSRVVNSVMRDSSYFAMRSFLRSTGLPLVRWLGLKRIPAFVDDFFLCFVDATLKSRAADPSPHDDILQYLIDLHREELEGSRTHPEAEPLVTDTFIAAMGFLLSVNASETTSGTLAYCLYELALNPEIAQKCREEVNSILSRHGGDLSFDCLKDMSYLQCVIDETQRKYPVFGWLDRICTKDYEMPGTRYTVEKGTRVLIPVHALHHDPLHFPNPDKFDPDRFSADNKHNIPRGSYLPFGDGPRMCAGVRFAQTAMKTAVSFLTANYDFEPTIDTDIPLTFKRSMLFSVPQKGIWLRLRRRSEVRNAEADQRLTTPPSCHLNLR